MLTLCKKFVSEFSTNSNFNFLFLNYSIISLNMLVFGESILNDAVAIVLTTTVVESSSPEMAQLTSAEQIFHGIHRFLVIFLGSAGIDIYFERMKLQGLCLHMYLLGVGTLIGLVSSLVLKHVDLYYNPSLEFALMLCFVYIPCKYTIRRTNHAC